MDQISFKHRDVQLTRVQKFISHNYFEDLGLSTKVYPQRRPINSISHVQVEIGSTYDDMLKLQFESFNVGMKFGPLWSRHWFRVDVEIPESWVGEEVRLIWKSQTECLLWWNGEPVQGLSVLKDRSSYTITDCAARDNLRYLFYIECSCNGKLTGFNEVPETFQATLETAEIRVFKRDLFQLMMDLQVLYEMANDLPRGQMRADAALRTANDAINAFTVNNDTGQARSIARTFLQQTGGDSDFIIHLLGYANIDTAWLWPSRITPVKLVQSWSVAFKLMEKYDFKMAFTQPLQLQWVKERYPDFYLKAKGHIESGKLIPVGAAWIEMDANLPTGECLLRQMLYGQTYLQEEFHRKVDDLWLLDSFGFNAQLPQIMLHCGVSKFLTIKLSWNSVNTFPHSTFWWQGLGGFKVLVHFPPGTNYHKTCTVKEIVEAETVFKDTGRSNSCLFLFGHGNAGLGPREEMLEKLKRFRDLNGLPRLQQSSPAEFYKSMERDTSRLCTWVGELYLERHQGTYTTQAKVKRSNRKAEFLLREMDLWSGVASVISADYKCPLSEITRIWKLLLLNQFHDILPGTCHPEVYKDVHKDHEEIVREGNKLKETALRYVINQQASSFGKENNSYGKMTAVNSLPWNRKEVVPVTPINNLDCSHDSASLLERGTEFALIEVPSCGITQACPCTVEEPVSAIVKDGLIYLSNSHLSATVDLHGRIVELSNVHGAGQFITRSAHPGNQFLLYDDFPLFRDAWDTLDYNLETRKLITDIIKPARLVTRDPLRAVVKVCLRISETSHIQQLIILESEASCLKFHTQVKWNEKHKFLKVEFPTNLLSSEAIYEIQFGHVTRPTHYNTSWDAARYEVCGHKWAVLSEHGRGIALLNDSKYGYSCIGGTLKLSLLRAACTPDPSADVGDHEFTYVIMPFKGTLQEAGVIQQAYNLNCPVTLVPSVTSPRRRISFFWLDNQQVVLETVKPAEREKRALVLRLYEAFGGLASAKLYTVLRVRKVCRCNGLEEVQDSQMSMKSKSSQPSVIELNLDQFEILSLMMFF